MLSLELEPWLENRLDIKLLEFNPLLVSPEVEFNIYCWSILVKRLRSQGARGLGCAGLATTGER